MAVLLKSAFAEAVRPAFAFDRQSGDPSPEQSEEPLASLAHEVRRDLAADGVIVAWHEEGREPTVIFASGACEPRSIVERDMLVAARAAAASDGDQPVRWAPQADEPGTTGLLTTRIGTGQGVVTVTGVFRMIGYGARCQAREAALRLLPMVQAFFRLWTSRARATVATRGLTAALNSSNIATLLVDRSGRLGFVNRAAERILARNDGLRCAGDMLSGTRLADTMRLQAAIEHVIHGTPSGVAGAPVVALHRKGGRPLLAAILAADTHETDADAVAAVVHVFDPEQEIESMLDPVCRLYGLSAVEGRLATMLAGGAVLADAAGAMGIQAQTARSYLKQIFLKTDTNRQAELVWLMLQSAVRTAAGIRTRFF